MTLVIKISCKSAAKSLPPPLFQVLIYALLPFSDPKIICIRLLYNLIIFKSLVSILDIIISLTVIDVDQSWYSPDLEV
jgi:hypothetical protein